MTEIVKTNEKVIDFETLKKEILISLRGERTQKEINQLLGHKFNQCAKWESGEKRLMWREFMQLLDIYQVNIRPIFVAPFRYFGDPLDGGMLTSFLSGGKRPANIATDLHVPREKVARWMSGKQDLSFEEMLEVFHHYYPDHVVNLIDAIVSIRHLPTMYAQFKHALGIKDYLKAHPYALAVLKCLRLEEYQQNKRHLDGLISKLVGITFDLEKEALRSLVHHGIIEFREERYVIRNKSFTYVMRYQKSKNFRKYYQHRLLEFFDLHENLPAGCFMFHDVWAIPKENMREVIDLCFDFCIKVRKLTENNQTSAKYIRGVNLSLFTLDK